MLPNMFTKWTSYFLLLLSTLVTSINLVQSQPRLTIEVEQMVTSLVSQINAYPEIRTVAIEDFTDLNRTPTLLGRQIAEEFLFDSDTRQKLHIGEQKPSGDLIQRSWIR
jgi:hypothetical protein